MTSVRNHVRFYLNDQLVRLDALAPDTTLLDFLRLERGLTGSKEGCAEGDCGACTVLVGRRKNDRLIYEAVTACIRFVASLDGCHVVTIEHLRGGDGGLHPVQQAMIEMHGSQCGFCTPGIVMSLYGLWMEKPNASRSEIEEALQGNLCRCTGYAPIIRAGQTINSHGALQDDALVAERARVMANLTELDDGVRVEMDGPRGRLIVPASADDLAEILESEPKARLVAGSTDVGLWVTKFMRDISPAVFIGNVTDLQRIAREDAALVLGAGVTYSEALPYIEADFPQMAALWTRIGGVQVRNMGTIGGNIANGSPIGDTPPPLIVLGAEIVLRKGKARRTIRLEDYFIAYGNQDRAPGEFVESIRVPYPKPGDIFVVHKVSKRRDEDISTLCGAFRLRISGGKIVEAIIAFGGMAATPKRARTVELALIGQDWTEATILAAQEAFAADFQPISDMRASADYRLLVAKNLLMRVYLENSDGAKPTALRVMP